MKNKRRNRRVQALIVMGLLLCLQLNANISTARDITAKEAVMNENTKKHRVAGISATLSRTLTEAKVSDEHQPFSGVSEVLRNQLQECRVTIVAPERHYKQAGKKIDEDETKVQAISETLEISEEMEVENEEEVETVEEKPKPNEYEVEILARLINGEVGNQSDECQLATGTVVLNRVKSAKFPKTLEKVIFQTEPTIQYACVYDGNFDKEPSQQAWDNARWLLENELSDNPVIVLPENVVYQSEFEQGSGIYKKIGPEIFCYE